MRGRVLAERRLSFTSPVHGVATLRRDAARGGRLGHHWSPRCSCCCCAAFRFVSSLSY